MAYVDNVIARLGEMKEHFHCLYAYVIEQGDEDLLADAILFLKRKAPAKPMIVKAEFPYRKSVAYCGACGVRIRMAQNARDEYCWKCGRPVEWN